MTTIRKINYWTLCACCCLFALFFLYRQSFLLRKLTSFSSNDVADFKPAEATTGLKFVTELDGGAPIINRWEHRFGSTGDGYVFFRHNRKTGGTTLRMFLVQVMNHLHEQKPLEKPVVYSEIEFTPMHWQCPTLDQERWNKSLSIVALRHPLERHISDFFYTGPGKSNARLNDLHQKKNFSSPEYASLLRELMPTWVQSGIANENKRPFRGGTLFIQDYQVKALIGNSTYQSVPSYHAPNYECALRSQGRKDPVKDFNPYLLCGRTLGRECGGACDGPCSGPHFGKDRTFILGPHALEYAKKSLQAFDLVLITETMSNPDQVSLMTDFFGISVDIASQFFQRKNSNQENQNITGVYQEILSNVAPELVELLLNTNKDEIDLYEHAVEVNRKLTKQWLRERDQMKGT